jgi:dipeptidyl aminopeptidase/acylaminoacyl peptidase
MFIVGRLIAAVAVAVAFAATGVAAPAPGTPEIVGTIAYDLGNRLALSALDGSDYRVLLRTPSSRTYSTPFWAPDGTAIAFVRGQDVYVTRAADRDVLRVAHLPGFIDELRWSPDGSRLAFSWVGRGWCEGLHRQRALYVADARGHDVRRIGSADPARRPPKSPVIFNVVGWSSDGKRLLYGEERWRVGGDCGRYMSGDLVRTSLFHIGVGGGRPTPISAGSAGPAQWSPDGKLLVMCGRGVSVTRTDGRVVRRWPDEFSDSEGCNQGSAQWIAWSRQSDEVYAATGNRVVALRVSDGRRRVLLADPGLSCTGDFGCTTFIHGLSSDGRFLLVEAQGGKNDRVALIALTTDGKQRYRLPYPRHARFSIFLS